MEKAGWQNFWHLGPRETFLARDVPQFIFLIVGIDRFCIFVKTDKHICNVNDM
jgi:hypothetical protein